MDENATARTLVRQASEVANESVTIYHQWVGQMLNLAVGSMTLLVALKSHLIPSEPRHLWLLQACWILLAGSIASASVILHSKHLMLSKNASDLLKIASGSEPSRFLTAKSGFCAELSSKALPWLLSCALISLALFAVFNTGAK
jgi:hypothetical protein